MELVRGLHNLQPRHHGCALTIGNFDGVHLGHQAMLDTLCINAERLGVPPALLTFEPHPLEALRPEQAPTRITPLRDKLAALADTPLARVLVARFGPDLSGMSAEAFIETLLIERLGVRFLLIGDDFRFGRARAGDFSMLAAAAERHGFELDRLETLATEDGERISSTRVRGALAEGDLAEAEDLLGRPYELSGRVVRGDAIGRQLGFRTANIAFRPNQRPALGGIFTVSVEGVADRPLPAVANVGTRPAVGGRKHLLEVHLLDWQGTLYGCHLKVRFLQRLRAEWHFDSLDALSAQIGRDVDQAQALFAENPL
ncbi:riboflavin kinase/FMN adenylyltransferase [Alkalispirillum mobile]|uniref:Riboflavin biosynthesis protein n=1 Tax=Alkalispirillum mobile TaxID=85925 RepID=A0A498BXT9_9GAMM|nr:bifunctional riboflavin kinase/FAD synthetase [Alkalispirillum mobile]RLK48624.1 riboflavin kinase/FMN adenylyltransferase [Alkalispirillum mobile]